MAAKAKPKCTQVSVQTSRGGKVTIVKFDLSANYGFSESRTYEIPSTFDQSEIDEFINEEEARLSERVEARAQPEVDDLMEQSLVFNSEGEFIG